MALDRRPPYSYEEYQRIAMAGRSFTGPAVLTLVLYFVLWIPGLVANIVFLHEATQIEHITGYSPPGKGCLIALLVFAVVPLILGVCIFMSLIGQLH